MKKYVVMFILSLTMMICLLLVFTVLGVIVLFFNVKVFEAGALAGGVALVVFIFSYAVLALNGHRNEKLETLLRMK